MAFFDQPSATDLSEQQVDADSQQHDNERRWNDRILQRLQLPPEHKHSDREQPDHSGPQMKVAGNQSEFRERVFVVRLNEGHITFGVGIVPENVRDLFQNQNDADSCQQTLNHAGREEGRESSCLQQSEADLQ